jgi:thiol-disulfide isomerase/thioredoxin
MLATGALAIRIILIGVFLLAAVAKLYDRNGLRQILVLLRVPHNLHSTVVAALPLAELTIAVALIIPGTLLFGAIGSAVLLSVLTLGVAFGLYRNVSVPCACFGPWSRRGFSIRTLLRNAILLIASGAVILAAIEHPKPWFRPSLGAGLIAAAGTLIAVALTLQTWLIIKLMSQHGRLLDRITALERSTGSGRPPSLPAIGLGVGTRAPGFELQGLTDSALSLSAMRSAKLPVLIVFMSPACAPCMAFAPQLLRLTEQYADITTAAILIDGNKDDLVSAGDLLGFMHVGLDHGGSVAALYASPGTPSAVLVDGTGFIAAPMAVGPEEIRALFRLASKLPTSHAQGTKVTTLGR